MKVPRSLPERTMYLLRMPKADENMAEGTVVRWLVPEGDDVSEGRDLVECLADKGEFTVWAEEGGTLARVFAPENSVVPVGYVLAAVSASGERDDEGLREALARVESENARLLARAKEELHATGAGARPPERVRATPAARRLARERGVSLADVAARLESSRGGGGLVRESDVEEFVKIRAEAPGEDGA
jgi:pyruvate dehydrogenase E2 component (dihydrolipoamide acetyltransferase)